jgi:uncharacterized protein (DUF2252 family)
MGKPPKADATSAAKPADSGSGEAPKQLDPLPHPTPQERKALGEAARAKAPLSEHARWGAGADRPDPIDLLEEQAKTRLPELVPIRYGRMISSPFAFFRGAALVMASDLSSTPRSGLKVQACGDAHLSNFGVFGSPERELLFDINDFDETLPGPWEWDVKRLAASITVAGRVNGFTKKERKRIVVRAANSYREAMAQFATMSNLAVWYSRSQIKEGLPQLSAMLDKKTVKEAQKLVDKAKTKDSMSALAKLTNTVNGEPRIISAPPLIIPAEELLTPDQAERFMSSMEAAHRSYRHSLLADRRHLLEQYRFVQLALKVVGVGSVGTRAWIMLLLGRDGTDPLFLQAKEAQASVLESYVGKSHYANHGQRVVEGQRLMQAASDIFLGWDRVKGVDDQPRDFYFRQLYDWKGSWPPESMVPESMGFYGWMCAWTLARAHARSGDRIAIAAYLGETTEFEEAIAEFAETYADQNEKDYAALKEAVKSGRVTARTDV